ncbi:5'-methylthioadenosine/S-adenosylhomocysteine nucleosidase OS=Streptomyces tendae OX=1932 GN=GUR47_13725 PE=4 SV=1 [Streptomyces tendae]
MPDIQPTVLVLTALPLEYAAVRTRVEEREERVHRDGTRVEVGRLPGTSWHVALAELGMGAERTAALTTQLIHWLRPEAVLFVGVAGSLKDDVGIGDVVVGTQVYEIHGGKQAPEGFLVRPKALPGSHALEQAAALRRTGHARREGALHAHRHRRCGVGRRRVGRSPGSSAGTTTTRARSRWEGRRPPGGPPERPGERPGDPGISDRADAGKHEADTSGSQQRAAEHAAAVTVAALLKYRRPRGLFAPCGGPPAAPGRRGDVRRRPRRLPGRRLLRARHR